MEDDDFDDDWIEDDEEPAAPAAIPVAPARPRRRRGFGALVKKMGKAASATPGGENPERAVEQRIRVEQGQRLLAGGKNKGEQRGYGAASGRQKPPPLR